MKIGYITVLGQDGIKHLADPQSKKCLCGVAVQSVKVDLSQNNETCYDCEAILEDELNGE